MRDLRAAIRNQPPVEKSYDWDPFHMPGAVQSYGVLLVVEPRSRRILFASANAGAMLGIGAEEMLNKSYLVLTEAAAERKILQDQIAPDTILFPNPVRLTIRGRAFNAIFHAQGGEHLIELEPVDLAARDYADLADRAVVEMFEPSSVEDLYQRAVQVVRDVTGFDRVMLYRFDARYNGQVLAEARREGIGSFLGLFFPSADIGARIRSLYLENFTRYIPDLGSETHPLIGIHPGNGLPDSVHPVDMTHTNLRSVAPCHIQYLQNMGVRASISFSINVDNRLWGLFACHHYAPRPVSFDQRVVCEQTAMMFIFKLNAMNSTAARFAQRAENVRRLSASLAAGTALVRRIAGPDVLSGAAQEVAGPLVAHAALAVQQELHWLIDVPHAPPRAEGIAGEAAPLTPGQRLLLDLVEADSAAIVRAGAIHRLGDAPPDLAIYAIASMFGRELPDLGHGNLPVFATDCLAAILPAARDIKGAAAGILAVSLSDDAPAYLIWFRREQIVHATWAGNPEAGGPSIDTGPTNPRASFAAWKKDICNLSRPWLQEDAETAYEIAMAVRAAEAGGLAGDAGQDAVHGLYATAGGPGGAPAWPSEAAAAAVSGTALSVAATNPDLPPYPQQRPRRVIRIGQV